MSCNLGRTRTTFTVNSPVFVILFWFLVEHFKLSARTKDPRDTRDAFLESVYPCIDKHSEYLNITTVLNLVLGLHIYTI